MNFYPKGGLGVIACAKVNSFVVYTHKRTHARTHAHTHTEINITN